jgi:RNA polymerase sigma-70 factor (ECF subfamily)
MIDEPATIREVLAGDRDAFRSLIERYQRPVFSLLRNLCDDEQLCEDVAQETFLAAYRNLSRYDPARAQFSTWLLTIARNRCVNALNSRRVEPVEKLPEPIEVERPEDGLVQSEFCGRLDAALSELPLEQRTVFVLAEVMEMSHNQIAAIQSIELGTVKSRLHRAKRKLQEMIEELSERL